MQNIAFTDAESYRFIVYRNKNKTKWQKSYSKPATEDAENSHESFCGKKISVIWADTREWSYTVRIAY